MSNEDNRWVSDRTLGILICICLVLAPFTLGLSLLALFGIFCLSLMERQSFERRTILSEALVSTRLYRLELDEEGIIEEFHESYILPSHCPDCGAEIRLMEVQWIDHNTAICPACGANLRTLLI